MAVTKAHIKASNKYNKENYKKIQANIKPDDYNLIDKYCNDTKVSKAQLIVNACKEYMQKYPIKMEEIEPKEENLEEAPKKKTPIKIKLKKRDQSNKKD